MAIPTERDIRKPLLEDLDAAGGESRPLDAINRLAKGFRLLPADVESQTKTGVPRFRNRVMWARLHLVHIGCLARGPAGIWRLTELGRKVARDETPMPGVKKGRMPVRKEPLASKSGPRRQGGDAGTIEGLGRFINFDPYDAKRLPDKPGVYVFYDISDRPIYVGEAQSIVHRIRTHHEKFWFKRPIVESASYVEIGDAKLRKQVEAVLIRFLKRNAVLNKQHVDRS